MLLLLNSVSEINNGYTKMRRNRKRTLVHKLMRFYFHIFPFDLLLAGRHTPSSVAPIDMLACMLIVDKQMLMMTCPSFFQRTVDVNLVHQFKSILSLISNSNVCSNALFFLDKTSLLSVVVLQFDSLDSKQIKIRCQPRKQFHPRTQKESETAAHYLRCEQLSEYEYPTIDV